MSTTSPLGRQPSALERVAALELATVPIQASRPRSPARHGLTLEVLFVAAVLTLPALWTAIVEGDLPVAVVVERYVIIMFGVLMISEPLYWLSLTGRGEPRPFSPVAGHSVPREGNVTMADEDEIFGTGDFASALPERNAWESDPYSLSSWDAPPTDADYVAPGAAPADFEPLFPEVVGDYTDLDDIFGGSAAEDNGHGGEGDKPAEQ